MKSVYNARNLRETNKIAKKFAKKLNGGEVILLIGEIGAGKTAFSKSVIKQLGYKGVVASPTFTIMQQYFGKKFEIYHFDLYRLESADEGRNFGLDDFIFKRNINAVVLIEWPERVIDMLRGDFVVVSINKTGSEDEREIVFDYKRF